MKFPWNQESPRSETVLGSGTEFRGDVMIKGTVHIHGRVDGDVYCEEHLVIGPQAQIEGNLHARLVSVGGRVNGQINASERVELLDTAKVVGDVFAPRLTVVDGANMEGGVHMTHRPTEVMERIESRTLSQLELPPPPASPGDDRGPDAGEEEEATGSRPVEDEGEESSGGPGESAAAGPDPDPEAGADPEPEPVTAAESSVPEREREPEPPEPAPASPEAPEPPKAPPPPAAPTPRSRPASSGRRRTPPPSSSSIIKA